MLQSCLRVNKCLIKIIKNVFEKLGCLNSPTFFLADKNVEVIYVCPVQLGEDLIHYYTHLLGLDAAIETGKPTPSSCAKSFTILTPEAHQHFSVWFTARKTIPDTNHLLRIFYHILKINWFTWTKLGMQGKSLVW